MKIEIIIIASEILQGKIQDKNAHWLAQNLIKQGLQLSYISVVNDEREQLLEAFKIAHQRSDLIITSGGLGPTLDDCTKFILAEFYHLEIKPRDETLQICREHYKRLNREYDEANYHYHKIPIGFKALKNRTGLAPGLYFEHQGKKIICAPGVPHEFISILEDQLPNLNKGVQKVELFNVKTSKLPESKIFSTIMPTLWQTLEKYGAVSSLPNLGGVDIGVVLTGSATQIENSKNELTQLFLKSPLKENIYYIGTKTLEEIIVEKAVAKNISFGFAESCTGGLNSSRITDVSGSSQVFMGSIISYSNEIKINHLNVDRKIIESFGAVSSECASAMALGLRSALGVEIAVATTGIAGPTGGSAEKPVGTIFLAVASKTGLHVEKLQLQGNREILKLRFSQAALFSLHDCIEKNYL